MYMLIIENHLLDPKLIDSLSFRLRKPNFLVLTRGGFLDFVWIIFQSFLIVVIL